MFLWYPHTAARNICCVYMFSPPYVCCWHRNAHMLHLQGISSDLSVGALPQPTCRLTCPRLAEALIHNLWADLSEPLAPPLFVADRTIKQSIMRLSPVLGTSCHNTSFLDHDCSKIWASMQAGSSRPSITLQRLCSPYSCQTWTFNHAGP